jgi:hypothetical protein
MDLTERQLKFGYWFLTHKQKLKKILIIFLIVLNAGLWGYSIFRFSLYFARSSLHEKVLLYLSRDLVDLRMRTKFRPKDLSLSTPKALLTGISPQGLSQYDFVVEVENPNPKWAITSLNYKFSWPGGASQPQQTFILPEQTKHLLALGQEVKTRPQNIQCEFLEINWKRVKQPFLEKLAGLDISCENVKFIPASVSRKDGKEITFPAQVQFEAVNNTVYSFWQISFNVILLQGQIIVGVNSVPLEQFLSGQTRLVTATWTEKLARVTKVIVEPEVNILDPEVIMPLK